MKNLTGFNIRAWLEYVTEHPYRVLIVLGVVTLFFLSQIPRLKFETSIYDLEIEDLPATAHYQTFKKDFGTEEVILVVARAENVFAPKTFEGLDCLSSRLAEIKGVRSVISLPGIKRQMDVTGRWSLEDYERVVSSVGLFEKNILTKDRKATALSLILEDGEGKEEVIEAVERIIAKSPPSLSLYQIGMPEVSKALSTYTERDFLLLVPVTFAMIVLILFFLFRSIRGVLIPTTSLLIVLIWTFGLMGLTGSPLSMITMIVPIFLIAVGTAYCMHIFSEYLIACEESGSSKEVTFRTFLHVALPTFLTILTTFIGLGSLLVNPISAIRQFSLFSSIGMLAMLIVILTFLPAVMTLLAREIEGQKRGRGIRFDRFLDWVVRLNLEHQKTLFIILAVISLAGIAGMSRLRIETNPLDFFKPDTAVSRHFHDIYRDLAGSFPMNVTIEGKEEDWFEDPVHLKVIEEVQQFLSTVKGVDKTISFVDYLKLFNYADNKYDPQFYKLPEERFQIRMIVNNLKTILGQDFVTSFMTVDFLKANIMLRTHLSSSTDFLNAEKEIRSYLEKNLPKSYSAQVTGLGVVISQSSDLLTEGQVQSLLSTLALVFVVMFLLLMSWKVGLIGILPNLFPIFVCFGFMGWMGIPLSTATSLIASIAIGLAVDDTIHYLVRYNVEFKKNLNEKQALAETLRKLGEPMLFTTLTISIGFSALMASNFKPTAIFGLLMVITLASALSGYLFLLPWTLLHVELVTLWDLMRMKMGKDPQKGIPLFSGLSRTQVHYILIAGAIKAYKGGDLVIKKGEVSDSMYAVISGELDVFDEISCGKDETSTTFQLVNHLRTGDVFGEMGMIRACKRSATVMATGPVELLQINDRMIKRLNWLYPPTARKFFLNLMRGMCDRLEKITASFVKASIVDSQSGLHTGGFLAYMLEKEMAKARQEGHPLSVGVLQFKNLEEINRTYGHHVGAQAVLEAAKALKTQARASDLLYRYDPVRFAFVVEHRSPEEASNLFEKYRHAVCSCCITQDGKSVSIEADLGVAAFDPARHGSVQAFINEALRNVRI